MPAHTGCPARVLAYALNQGSALTFGGCFILQGTGWVCYKYFMDDEAYWVRCGSRKMSGWPSGAKTRALEEHFPGCKSAVDAVKSILRKTAEPPEMSPTMKFNQVSAEIRKRLEQVDSARIPAETRDRLAKMPIETVDQIRAWGFAWLEEIRKLNADFRLPDAPAKND